MPVMRPTTIVNEKEQLGKKLEVFQAHLNYKDYLCKLHSQADGQIINLSRRTKSVLL